LSPVFVRRRNYKREEEGRQRILEVVYLLDTFQWHLYNLPANNGR